MLKLFYVAGGSEAVKCYSCVFSMNPSNNGLHAAVVAYQDGHNYPINSTNSNSKCDDKFKKEGSRVQPCEQPEKQQDSWWIGSGNLRVVDSLPDGVKIALCDIRQGEAARRVNKWIDPQILNIALPHISKNVVSRWKLQKQ